MNTEIVEYFDGSQKMIGQWVYSTTQTQDATIILFHAFEGRGDFTLDYAQQLADHGFNVFVADMYGNAIVAHTIEDCFKLITPFLQDRGLVRRRALLAYQVVTEKFSAAQQSISAMGFCFGGMCALELARSGSELNSVITLHGVLAKSELTTHSIKAKILVLHGYRDPQVPPSQLPEFAQEMQLAGVDDWTVTFFGHAMHSFTDPKTGSYDPEKEQTMGRAYHKIAALRSFRYAVDFLQN